jgi:hypothetical protein
LCSACFLDGAALIHEIGWNHGWYVVRGVRATALTGFSVVALALSIAPGNGICVYPAWLRRCLHGGEGEAQAHGESGNCAEADEEEQGRGTPTIEKSAHPTKRDAPPCSWKTSVSTPLHHMAGLGKNLVQIFRT